MRAMHAIDAHRCAQHILRAASSSIQVGCALQGGAAATYPPEESVSGLLGLIERLGPADNGHFFDFQGKAIPW